MWRAIISGVSELLLEEFMRKRDSTPEAVNFRMTVHRARGTMADVVPTLYQFECARCGYRARVTGGAADSAWLTVQTICCHDCRALHDAVLRIKSNYVPPSRKVRLSRVTAKRIASTLSTPLPQQPPPRFPAVLDRLRTATKGRGRWLDFDLACPVSARHRISRWKRPGKCPRCGADLEPAGAAFRIWE